MHGMIISKVFVTGILRNLRHFKSVIDIFSTGLFELTAEDEYITICPRQSESYGIRWTCYFIHREFSGHTAQPPKGNRGVNLFQVKTLFSETGKVFPVSSRKFLFFEGDSSGRVVLQIRAPI